MKLLPAFAEGSRLLELNQDFLLILPLSILKQKLLQKVKNLYHSTRTSKFRTQTQTNLCHGELIVKNLRLVKFSQWILSKEHLSPIAILLFVWLSTPTSQLSMSRRSPFSLTMRKRYLIWLWSFEAREQMLRSTSIVEKSFYLQYLLTLKQEQLSKSATMGMKIRFFVAKLRTK